jgi:hypothetical protein
VALGAFAAVSQAETIGNAGRAAEAQQKSLCGGPWNWVCANDTDPWPACHNTGVNQVNRTEWQCLGGYDETQITTGTGQRWCGDTIGVGPYGGITAVSVSCSR